MNERLNTIRRASNIFYADFRAAHLLPNQPLLIGPELVASWSCMRTWRADPGSLPTPKLKPLTQSAREKNGEVTAFSTPNLIYLRDKYGNLRVPVDKDGCRSEMTLWEALDIWEGKDESVGDNAEERLYVKDWHLALQLEAADIPVEKKQPAGDGCMFYTTPGIFADDWMNGYYRRNTNDDFRFVYMGQAGTFTRLHRDVYTSYAWSTNVVGRKRWWLFPPEVTAHITKPNGENISDGSLVDASFDLDEVDETIWPNWEIAKCAMYVVDQEEGDTLFVPSGWYHQVLNLTFCISINHNWSNAHNLASMYHSMVDAVERVEASIEDVKGLLQTRLSAGEWEAEWRRVVQNLLKQEAGWDWSTFLGVVLLGVEDCKGVKREMCGEPSQSQYADLSFSTITPAWQYVLEQVTPCITHFTTSSWGQSGEYDALLSRISNLICQ